MKVKMSPEQALFHAKSMAHIIIDTFRPTEGEFAMGLAQGALMILEVLDRYNLETGEYDAREFDCLEVEYTPEGKKKRRKR